MKPRLHVVDGTFELYRAQYSKRPGHNTPDGQDVKGTVGVMRSLLALLADPSEAATHLAVSFDNPIESFRNAMFSGYKTGDGMDPVLVAQMDLVEEAVSVLGITVWSMQEFEADDALASAAVRYRDDVSQVRIMTPDKDLGQSVCAQEVVQVDRIRQREIDEHGVFERNGIAPGSIPDWLALVGDSADGIPGLKGFGAKTAASLLNAYDHIEHIPLDAADWTVKVRGAEKLAATLRAAQSEVALYKQLATLRTDVPLKEPFDALRWVGAPRSRFEAFAAKLGGLNFAPDRWL